jgi:hypothetical protein
MQGLIQYLLGTADYALSTVVQATMAVWSLEQSYALPPSLSLLCFLCQVSHLLLA